MNAIDTRFYFYLHNNEFKKDFNFNASSISRSFKSYLYNCSYDIKNILKSLILEPNKQLTQNDIDIIFEKSSQILKIKIDLIKSFVKACSLFSSKPSDSLELIRKDFSKFSPDDIKKFKHYALEIGLSKSHDFLQSVDFSYYKAK
jgi:hypothetical protein